MSALVDTVSRCGTKTDVVIMTHDKNLTLRLNR